MLWENTTNERVLEKARAEIRSKLAPHLRRQPQPPARGRTGSTPIDCPAFHDPFAGGGSIPLEAQRLGLESYASDLNPVAVLINKAMIEIPPRFAGRAPVNPERNTGQVGISAAWKGATGLAEDVRYYGKWMRDEAEKRIGHLYPKVEVTAEMAAERPDLERYRRDASSPSSPGSGRAPSAALTPPSPTWKCRWRPPSSCRRRRARKPTSKPVIGDGGYHFTVKARDTTGGDCQQRHQAHSWKPKAFHCVPCPGVPDTLGDYIKG